MATVTKPEAATTPSFSLSNFANSSNVFVLLYLAVQGYIDTCNFDATVRYSQQDLMNRQLKDEMADWKRNADALPDAGKQEDTPATSTVNGDGIGAATGMFAAAAALAVIAKVILGIALAGGPFTVALIAVAALLAAAAIALTVLASTALTQKANWNSNFLTHIPGHTNYDQGEQSKAQNAVSQNQQTVQQLQNQMSQILQQYITPVNNAKDSAANFQQALFQWLKAIVPSS